MQNPDEDFYVKRTITLPRTSKLTEEVIQQLDHILDYSPPEEYRNTLIEIYHPYICKEHESLPYEFRLMADHMYFLVDFFRKASEEMSGVGATKLPEAIT
jgi:hypothetical protein